MRAIKKTSVVEIARDSLRRELHDGSWDGRIPGTRLLAARLGVSPPTVAAALEQLAQEGLLVRGGSRRAYRVAHPQESGNPRSLQRKDRELLILTHEEPRLLVEATRQMLEMLVRRMAGKRWLVRQQVVDFLHVKRPQASWDRLIGVRDGTKVVAVYGRQALAEWATRRKVPILFLGGDSGAFPVPKVAVSSSRMAEEVMTLLATMGHRRIVLPLCDRSEDFKKSMRDVTRRVVERAGDCYVPGYHNPQSSYCAPDVMRRILARTFSRQPPTALVLLDWNEAVAASCFLTEHGLRVPRDVSLALLSDSVTADWFHPKLCRFRFPQERMLSEISKWLEEKSRNKHGAALSGIYVAGDSIGPPPNGMQQDSSH